MERCRKRRSIYLLLSIVMRRCTIFLICLIAASYCFAENVESLIADLKNPGCTRVFSVAHRSCWRNAPENSLQAIKSCIEMGVDIVEIDVRLTKDNHLVLMHDETVDRTTTGKGYVKDLTLADINKLYLKNGANHKTRHRVPTLTEALIEARGKVLVNIDKGYDYFPQIISVLTATGTANQVILKNGNTYSEVVSNQPNALSKTMFMPVVDLNTTDAVQIINEYLTHANEIIAFELNFESELPSFRQLFKKIRNAGCKIFVNSLWPELCAGHDDDIACEESKPDESWGWLINMGASMIQTDRPKELIHYINSRTNLINKTIYVNPNLGINGDGSITAPYTDINAAISTAQVGDTIAITNGEILMSDSDTNMLTLSKNLTIIGGFSKDFTQIIGTTSLNGNNQCNHVVRVGLLCNVSLHNIEVCNGNASTANENAGGGIFNEGTLLLHNCNLHDNKCLSSAGGGAIYNKGNLQLRSTIFSNNKGYGDGGAIYSIGTGYVEIIDCHFEKNASKSGSAIFIRDTGSCYISGSSFVKNQSETYGTVTFYNKDFSNVATLVNNSFANNTVSGHTSGKTMLGGSAIYCYGAISSTFNVVNNTIIGNSCDAFKSDGSVCDELGGALTVRQGNLKMNNNIIVGNYSASGFGDLYKTSTGSIAGDYNFISCPTSSNVRLTANCLNYTDYDLFKQYIPGLLDVTLNQDRVSANLSYDNEHKSHTVKIRNAGDQYINLCKLPKSQISEIPLNCDLNNDGIQRGSLDIDQWGNYRQCELSCVGAYEIPSESSNYSVALPSVKAIFDTVSKKITVSGCEKYTITVYDASGRSVICNPIAYSETDLSWLHAGVYIAEIQTNKHKTITIKLMIN